MGDRSVVRLLVTPSTKIVLLGVPAQVGERQHNNGRRGAELVVGFMSSLCAAELPA